MATKPKGVQKKTPAWAKVILIISLVLLVFIGFVANDIDTQDKQDTPPAEQKTEPTPQPKAEPDPDFVRNGKLVWNIPVCTTAEDYTEYLHAYVQKDTDTMAIYEKKYRCWILKTGVRVSVLEWRFIKPTKIRVYADGDMFDLYTSAQFVKGAE